MRQDRIAYWRSKDGQLKLEAWARDGLSDEQLMAKIGITKSTFYRWRQKYPEVKAALAKGKEVADIEVENAMFKRAIGYDKEIQKKHIQHNPDGSTTQKIEVTTIHIQGDVGAQIFWLKNRKPNTWKNEQDTSERDALDKLDRILQDIDRRA